MITGVEAARSLYGAYRLARLDPQGMSFLDNSPEAALRSFWAAALILPVHLLLEFLPHGLPTVTAPLPRLLSVEGVFYVVLWTAYPVLMIHVTALIGRSERLPAFIIAYNWAGVIGSLAQVPIAIVGLALGQDVWQGLFFALFLALMGYQWFVTKTALNVTGGMAAGLVAADFVLTLFIANLKIGLLQAGG